MSHTPDIRMGRVYDEPTPEEGHRVLVDRLWSRGIRKDDPRIGQWCKDVAPSTELREWYGHQPERYEEFCQRYAHDLAGSDYQAGVEELRQLAAEQTLTLVTATKDLAVSHVPVLKQAIESAS